MTEQADVVFTFSTETFADAIARSLSRPPGRMLQTLCSSPRVGNLLVVDAPRWLPARLRRPAPAWPSELGSPRPHFRPTRLARREPHRVDMVRASIRGRENQLQRAVHKHGLDRPVIITFDPLLAAFGRFDWAGPVTFYGRDDWSRFPPREPWWPAYEAAYEALRDTSRGVLAVSSPLLARIAPTGPAAVITNGIDPQEWRRPAPPPEWFQKLARPVHTYVGTIDERVDETLIDGLARAEGTVLLVGPIEHERRSRLEKAGAVLYRAADRAELAAIVHASDTGLIPHRTTELTTAMSPLKLYEYRAAGLPVVSVDLPPIALEAADDNAIFLAASRADDFSRAAAEAARRGRDSDEARNRYIKATSWAGRHEAALEIALR